MPVPAPPANWEVNEISKFFDAARNNEIATFANHTEWVARLSDVDLGYRKSIDGFNHSQDWFAGIFLVRAHSNFLAACRLCWSVQLPEGYALLRSCLENALYGLYLSKHPDSCETWLRRGEDPIAKQKVKDEFTVGALLRFAIAQDAAEGAVAKALYERTIDSGAHPNELAFMQTLKMDKNADRIQSMQYLGSDSVALLAALKTTAQVGACTLSLFRVVHPERFDIMGVSDLLRHVKVGL